jgi:hypothetical protein
MVDRHGTGWHGPQVGQTRLGLLDQSHSTQVCSKHNKRQLVCEGSERPMTP